MDPECCIQDVKAIFQCIDEHATAVDRTGKPRLAKLARWSNWLSMIGIWLVAVSLIAHQAVAAMRAPTGWVLGGTLAFAAGGLVVMLIGTVLMVIDSVRTMKPPMTELMDRLLDVLPQETGFVTRLTRFDEYSLEFARRRLEIESNKVLSRLDLIGGDSVMKTSLLGIGVVLVTLVVSYREVDFSKLSFAVLSVFGLALVAGMSIGAWRAKSGAHRAGFYVGMLSLAIYSKENNRASRNRPAPWKRQAHNGAAVSL